MRYGWIICALMITAMTAVVLLAEGETDLSKHLLAKWDFDQAEGSVAVDASGNKHDGRMGGKKGTPPKRVKGMVGKAMQFSAADATDIIVRNHPHLNPTDGLTIAAWIKHEGRTHEWVADILSKKWLGKTVVNSYRFVTDRRGRLLLEIGDGKAVFRVETAKGTVQPGAWCHVAGTFSPGRVCLYVNGRLVMETKVAAQRIEPSRNHLVIGNFAGRRNAFPFNGLIDEVYLFDVALEAEDIFKLAQPEKLQQ